MHRGTLLLAIAIATRASPFSKRSGSVHLPATRSIARPYTPRADGTADREHLRHLAARAAVKFGGANQGSGDRRRAEESEAVTDEHWGTEFDLQYYATVQAGTPAQSMQVLMDTGSSNLWFTGRDCEPCSGSVFDYTKSSTWEQGENNVNMTYGSGWAGVTNGTDVVSFGPGLTIEKQPFGVATEEATPYVGRTNGFVGLTWSNATTKIPGANFMANLVAEGKLDEDVIGIYLTPGGDGSNTSELSVGTTDGTKYAGEIVYYDLLPNPYFWMLNQTAVHVDGVAVAGTGFSAVIDSGTTFMYMPPSVAAAVFAAVPGASRDNDSADTSSGLIVSGSDVYRYPCATPPSISLTFGSDGAEYAVDPAYLSLGTTADDPAMCVSAIAGKDFGSDNFGNNLGIVGDMFLKSWYSAYSWTAGTDGGLAVGFAKAVEL